MTSINDISDLAEILQNNPQWREIIRSILLGEELLQLPTQLAEFVKATGENFRLVYERLERLETSVANLEAGQARLETSVANLEAGQTRLETSVAKLEAGQTRLETSVAKLEADQEILTSRLGNVIGSDYERRAAQSARRLARLSLGIRHARVLMSKTTPDRDEIPELLNGAAEDGTVSDDEADDLLRADLVLLGQGPDGNPAYAVCETAVTLYDHDVRRARRRASVLERAAGVTALAAVIGQSAPPGTLDLAGRENVAFIELPDGDDTE